MTTRAQRALESLDVPEGFRAELINGEIILSPSGKPLHWDIQLNLIGQFRPLGWYVAADQTLLHPEYEDEPRPDLIAVSGSVEIDLEDAYYAEQVSLAVEVLSKWNRGTDLVDKVEVYARFGIPLYLIIDPFKGACILYRSPQGRGYAEKGITEFGEPIDLPEPMELRLATTEFRTYSKP